VLYCCSVTVKNNKLENVAIMMHCNLRGPNATPALSAKVQVSKTYPFLLLTCYITL